MSDADMKFASQKLQEVYSSDKELFETASEVAKQLGLGGLWRGGEASILIVANAIRGGQLK
jgi:hypothetical protein